MLFTSSKINLLIVGVHPVEVLMGFHLLIKFLDFSLPLLALLGQRIFVMVQVSTTENDRLGVNSAS